MYVRLIQGQGPSTPFHKVTLLKEHLPRYENHHDRRYTILFQSYLSIIRRGDQGKMDRLSLCVKKFKIVIKLLF